MIKFRDVAFSGKNKWLAYSRVWNFFKEYE